MITIDTKSATSAAENPHGDGRYIPALDGWRALAIALVILSHGLQNTEFRLGGLLYKVSAAAERAGALGVLIFFAISGYIITTRLYADSQGRDAISLSTFYLKRAFRILPPMLMYLLVLVLLHVAGVIVLTRADWSAPLFLANYFPPSWYMLHFWSLAVEEHFYLFWPVCIFLAGWKRALWIVVLLICAVGVWRPWQLTHMAISPSDARYDELRGDLMSHTDMRLDYIMMGCVIALAVQFYPAAARGLSKAGSAWGIVLLFAALAVTTRSSPLEMRSLQAIAIGLLVCGSSTTSTWFSRTVLENRVMLYVGKLSYSIYLWQQLFLVKSQYAWLRSPAALPLKVTAIFVCAYLSYRLVERPCIRAGRRVIERREDRMELLSATTKE